MDVGRGETEQWLDCEIEASSKDLVIIFELQDGS